MSKQCQKCHEHVSEDAFICPHCGAILGQSVQKAKPIPKTKNPKKKIKLPSVPWLGPVAMVLVVLAFVLAFPHYLKGISSKQETTAATDATTSTAPLVTYHVQVKGGQRVTLEHVLVEVYCDATLVATGVTGINGRTSFTIPESDEYQLRLVGLPVQYEANYRDSWFTFNEGQQELVIALENKPIPYVVKVVNENGEPIQGVSMTFWGISDRTSGVTNENGICTFESMYYPDVVYYVILNSVPNAYYKENVPHSFGEESTELVIVLPGIEEFIPDGMELYTVRVVDEYGQPVADTFIYSLYPDSGTGNDGSYAICKDGYTNLEGYFVYIGEPELTYMIALPQLPDYSEEFFYFDEDCRELLIQLDLEREEYTYTVYVLDQYGDPYPGVELYHQNPEGESAEDICYVSDENGMITFTCSESDPTKVVLYRSELSHGMLGRYVYSFDPYTRKMQIKVTNPDKNIIYQVTVQDQNGQPVAGAVLSLTDNMGQTYYATSDEDGLCIFSLYSVGNCRVMIQYLPQGYTGDLFSPRYFATGSRDAVWTVIAETEPAE